MNTGRHGLKRLFSVFHPCPSVAKITSGTPFKKRRGDEGTGAQAELEASLAGGAPVKWMRQPIRRASAGTK